MADSRAPVGVRPLRCLLIAPDAPPELRNGDAQYAEDLLRDPPSGVRYVRHTDAASRGELSWGPSLRSPATWNASPAAFGNAVERAALSLARRAGWLLPDPVVWVRLTGEFDLVHIHCTPVRFLGDRPPVLVSDSAGTFWYWSAGRGLPEQRVWKLLRREHGVAKRLRYIHPTANPVAEGVLFFIESGIELAAGLDLDLSQAVVCAPGVPRPGRQRRGDGRTLLFVAREFEPKGGPDAFRILASVRAELPEARLLVAGPDSPPAKLPDGVEWLGRVTRDELYAEVYPRADVFLYPTRFDCAPLVVQEALGHGLPVVAPRAMGIPDLVRDGETGVLFEPDDLTTAARIVVDLLRDARKRKGMAASAVSDFDERFSTEHRNEVLGRLYRALAA